MAPTAARSRRARRVAAARVLVAGNWKMHRGGPDAAALAREVVEALGGRAPEGVEVALLPPFPAIAAVREAVAGTGILVGAQACHPEASGAFTGEVAPEFLAAWGCSLVLCGHSERRRQAGEHDRAVRARMDAAVRAGLRPVLCVGETLEERESGRTGEVLHLQVVAALGGLPAADAGRVVIAYEPVWAIGTGRNATAEQVVKGHRTIRQALDCPPVPAGVGGTVRVIYGGSVTPGNAAALLAAPGVDGALVGGASLDAAGFAAIVRAAAPVGAARGGK